MTRFYPNLGYRFALPGTVTALGSVVLGGYLPAHSLRRRIRSGTYEHLNHWLFDPQLYMTGISPNAEKSLCTNLLSYPWLHHDGMTKFESGKHSVTSWNHETKTKVTTVWPQAQATIESDPQGIARKCVAYQKQLGPDAIVLPSPLTVDQSTDYSLELEYLDRGLDEVDTQGVAGRDVFATVALADACLRYWEPNQNALLQLICDAVTSRDVSGVYLVIEQGQEPADAKHCANHKTLGAALEIIHLIARDAGLKVVVNFLGGFGLVCLAAGADIFAADWYKSLYRLRLADTDQTGRAMPNFWSHRLASEVHLKNDFDKIVEKGGLALIKDTTAASKGLMEAAKQGKKSDSVAAWAYSQSNVNAAREHFLRAMKREAKKIRDLQDSQRLDYAEDWLKNANFNAGKVAGMLGTSGQTKLNHVDAWAQAVTTYRARHSV